MSNSLLNISMITKESLRILKNNLGFASGVNRQYDDQFAKSGAKIGSVINIRKPVRYTVSDGAALELQDQTDQSVALTLDSQKHVGFQFSSKEMALNIDAFSERYLKPAMAALSNKIDLDGLGLYSSVYNSTGTPGTTPNAFSFISDAQVKLDNFACPVDDMRKIAWNPAANGSLVDALKGLFHSSEQISKQYLKGRMGIAGGFEHFMDQNVRQHTTGTFTTGSTPVTNGASQSGSSLVTDGWANSTAVLTAGDVFTIANVYAVNPQSREITGQLQQFVVTSAVTSDGSGNATISISPSISASGQYQTVNALPADGAALTPVGTEATSYPQNMAFHKDAFVLGMADLILPGGVDMAERARDAEAGLAIRIVRSYDINNDTLPCRADVLYGWKAVYPELANRIWG